VQALVIFGEAATQLLPKIRELNPGAEESLLTELAEVFLSELCQQLLRVHKSLRSPPDDDDKLIFLLMFTEHGINRKTAESLYHEVITLGLEEPDLDKTPLQ
jgi:hypothetical protein